MRLLPREEINSQKVEEQRRNVEQGAKLAKSIDTLRETKLTETANLQKFRDASLETIKGQIGEASARLTAVLNEVEQGRKERQKLQKPLDEEWQKVRESKEAIEIQRTVLDEKERDLKVAIALNIQREREAKLELGRAEDYKHTAARELAEAGSTLERACKEEKQQALKINLKLAEADLRETETIERELKITARERDVQNFNTNLIKREKNVIDRERLLRDQYKTLERASNEIYGKRIPR